MPTFYRIRSKITGEFQGTPGRWTKSGKWFDSVGKIRARITNSMNSYHSKPNFDNWEIVEYEVVEKSAKSVNDVIDPKKLLVFLKKQHDQSNS